ALHRAALGIRPNRGQGPADTEGAMVERVQRLACACQVEAKATTRRQSRDQRALDEPLGIDDGVVVASVQYPAQFTHLAPGGGTGNVSPPASRRDPDDLRYCGMQRGNVSKALLHRPV